MIVSYAWTTAALVLGQKTATRRDWSPRTVALVRRAIDRGDTVAAYDKSARFGGREIAMLRPASVCSEVASDAPYADWAAEGFHVLQAIGQEFERGCSALDVWAYWRCSGFSHSVFRFEVLALTEYGRLLRSDAEARLANCRWPHGITLNRAIEEARRR